MSSIRRRRIGPSSGEREGEDANGTTGPMVEASSDDNSSSDSHVVVEDHRGRDRGGGRRSATESDGNLKGASPMGGSLQFNRESPSTPKDPPEEHGNVRPNNEPATFSEGHSQPPKPSLSVLDSVLGTYVNLASSALHQDRGLKLMQYSLWFASHIANMASTRASSTHSPLGDSNRSGAQLGPWNRRSVLMLQLVSRLCSKISGDICMARYATRLLGWPTALEALWTGSWTSESKRHPKLFRFLGKFLAATMVFYYPLEHVAYMYWMAPERTFREVRPGGRRSAEMFSAWSCRCWVAYILAEMTQCVLKWRELKQLEKDAVEKAKRNRHAPNDRNDASTTGENAEGTDTDEVAKLGQERRQEEILLVRNALFALPAIHWSLPNWDSKPWLPEYLVNVLMFVESLVSMKQSIQAVSL